MRKLIYIAILITFICADCKSDKKPTTSNKPAIVYSNVVIDTSQTIKEGFELLGVKDTLYLSDGVYNDSLDNIIPNGKVISALNYRKAIIRPDSSNWIIRTVGSKNITIKGFVLDGVNVRYSGIHISKKSNNINVIDNEIINTHFTGVLINQDSENNLIEGNEIHDFGNDKWDHGIYVGSDSNIIRGNKIYNVTGNGVNVYRSSSIGVNYVTVEYNEISNVGYYKGKELNGAGILLSRGIGHVARGNVITNSVFGVAVRYEAIKAQVYDNELRGNGKDIYLDEGIEIYESKNIEL